MKPFDLARVTGRLSIFFCLSATSGLAQTETGSTASEQQAQLQSIEQTTPVPANNVPTAGTFYSAQHSPLSAGGWPPLPANVNNLPAWNMGNGVWLLDDVGFDYSAASMQAGPMMMTAMDGISPPGSGGGTNIFNPPGNFPPPDYGTNLWIEITNTANSFASGWIHNSSIYVPYTIFSRQSLLWPLWHPETTFYGSWSTNLTAFSIPMLSRSNLFMMAESEIAPRIIGAGVSHFAALRRDGTVWSWGNGDSGQLGDSDWTNTTTPVQAVGLSNVVAIVVPPAGNHTLALDAYGEVWSWGANGYGQLGRHDGLYENEDSPFIVPGLSNIVAIASGSGHAIALKSDGTVWAWGDNAFGDLGDGSGTQRDYASPVPGLTNAIAIASGEDHCFAICANGSVWCWGLNEDWELGIGNADDQPVPVLNSNLTNVVALRGGSWHSIALLANGTIEAWGANSFGEIGDISSSTPVSVPGLSNIVSIACGTAHNLFINTNGNIFAWGDDGYGEFGDGGADYGSTTPYFLSDVSNVTAIAGGWHSSIISTGNGSIYTFGTSYEFEPVPTLTDIYTNYSSDGSGLPDWWELEYFHHLGLDPNSDPVGDGWSLLQDYEQGYNPTNFITPPAVTGLTVTETNAANGIQLTWNAENPTPLDYAIYRIDYNYDTWQYGSPQQIGEVNGQTTVFTDNGSVSGGDQNSIYEAIGIYGGGTSPFSADAYINSESPSTITDNLPFTAALVRNGTGRWQIMFSGLPTGLQTIRLYWYESPYLSLWDLQNTGDPSYTTQDIAVSNLVNDVYSISDGDVLNELGDTLVVQGMGPNGLPGQQILVGGLSDDAPYFVDGRQHMEQNLKFLIRAAPVTQSYGETVNGSVFSVFAEQAYAISTNFEEFSFLHHDNTQYGTFGPNSGDYYIIDDLWPFSQNYNLYSLLVTNIANGEAFLGTATFNFQPNFTTNIPAPPILGQGDPYWIWEAIDSVSTSSIPYDEMNWGLFFNDSFTQAGLESGIHNVFGLPYETGLLLTQDGSTNFYQSLPLGAEEGIIVTNVNNAYEYASWCPAPTLNFVNYYLAPVINPYGSSQDLPPGNGSSISAGGLYQPFPLPIDDVFSFSNSEYTASFSVTNQTPAVIFGAVGQPMILGAWAKYSIPGSSLTKYAYLGQYFTTNAWELDSAGNPTATNAGVVSPYGEFFPTRPGPAALITMTNLDTGTQATGIVNVISLALDANHDGTIDPTWNGPDFTSPTRPYRFWCNNNFDRWHIVNIPGLYEDIEQDNVLAGDTSYPSRNLDPNDPDCNYAVNGNRVIPDTRDLEDFARLWLCGFSSEIASNLPAGSTVTLSWGDVENPNPNDPTIDIFQAGDPDGGIEYLTNETSAQIQINTNEAPYIGRLAPGGVIQLNAQTLANGVGGNCFIWCGVSNGTGGLTLTIYDANSNVLTQTAAYIQIVDIKQMYERWTLGDDSSEPPSTAPELATNDLPAGISEPFRYVNPPEPSTPYILHVHGYNMPTWRKDRFAETEFKRLYWQGYQGRFGELRWPTTVQNLTGTQYFDISEDQAWDSGPGLLNLLTMLNSQYPGNVYLTAHSHGNIVAGQALKLATQEGLGQMVNTYVAMQAALDSHTYDPTTPVRSYSFSTPDRYGQYYTNGAPNYFYGSAAAGTCVNFFNTNDYALTTLWEPDQDEKPDLFYKYLSDPDAWWETTLSGLPTTELFFPTNTATIFAFIDQGHAYALGAQPNVGGVFLTGTNYNQVNLPDIWPPDPSNGNYTAHVWHSAEFRSDDPQRYLFWDEVLFQMGLKKHL